MINTSDRDYRVTVVKTNRSVRSRRASPPGNWRDARGRRALNEMVGHWEPPGASGDAGRRVVACFPTAQKKPIQRLVNLVGVPSASMPWGAPSITTIWLPLTAS